MENVFIYIGGVLVWVIFGLILCIIINLIISLIRWIYSKFKKELYEISYYISPKYEKDDVVKFKCDKDHLNAQIIYANSKGNAIKKFYETSNVGNSKISEIKFHSIRLITPIV